MQNQNKHKSSIQTACLDSVKSWIHRASGFDGGVEAAPRNTH